MCLGMPQSRESWNAGTRTCTHACTHARTHTHTHTHTQTLSDYRQAHWVCSYKAYADTRLPCTLMMLTRASHTLIPSLSPPFSFPTSPFSPPKHTHTHTHTQEGVSHCQIERGSRPLGTVTVITREGVSPSPWVPSQSGGGGSQPLGTITIRRREGVSPWAPSQSGGGRGSAPGCCQSGKGQLLGIVTVRRREG